MSEPTPDDDDGSTVPDGRPPLSPEEVLAAARAVAAEDEGRAGVAMFLALHDAQGSPPEGGQAGSDHAADGAGVLAARVAHVWDVLAEHDPDVTVQDALAVLADLELRPVPAPVPVGAGPQRLAALRPEGWATLPRAVREAEATEVVDTLAAGRLLRVVNYHDTPLSRRDEFARDLQWYAERFDPVTADDVHEFARTGTWASQRPGLVPVFYDGFASAISCALPLLEDVGLTGWFYPPTAFLDTPPQEQTAFAARHHYGVLEAPGGRLAMTWDDLADLATRHEVCGHSATHAASRDVRTAQQVEDEVHVPLAKLTETIGRTPAAWAWLGGTPRDPDAVGDRAVVEAGVRLWTSNSTLEVLTPRPART